jgi:hypothetical protein
MSLKNYASILPALGLVMMAVTGCVAGTDPDEVADVAESEVHATSIQQVTLVAGFTDAINQQIDDFGQLNHIQPTASRGEPALTFRGTATTNHVRTVSIRLPGELQTFEERFRDRAEIPVRAGDTGATVAARLADWARGEGFRARVSATAGGGTRVHVEAAVRVADVRVVEGGRDASVTGPDLVLRELGPGAFGFHFWRGSVQSARTVVLAIDGMTVRVPIRKGASSTTVVRALFNALDGLYERTGHYLTYTQERGDAPHTFTLRQRRPLR